MHLLRGVLRFRRVLAGRDHDGNVAEHDGLHAGPVLRVRPHREDDRPGCPAICRGMRIRAFEARAAHHTLIVRDRYSSNATAGNCTGNCTAVDVINTHDIGAVPAYRPGAGSFEGFFVAPKAASYVFVGVWDAALELSLSSTSDPRHLQVILGGATQTPPSNDDVVGGWTFFDGHWYFGSTETKNWADAQAACQAEARRSPKSTPGRAGVLVWPVRQRQLLAVLDRWLWLSACGHVALAVDGGGLRGGTRAHRCRRAGRLHELGQH